MGGGIPFKFKSFKDFHFRISMIFYGIGVVVSLLILSVIYQQNRFLNAEKNKFLQLNYQLEKTISLRKYFDDIHLLVNSGAGNLSKQIALFKETLFEIKTMATPSDLQAHLNHIQEEFGAYIQMLSAPPPEIVRLHFDPPFQKRHFEISKNLNSLIELYRTQIVWFSVSFQKHLAAWFQASLWAVGLFFLFVLFVGRRAGAWVMDRLQADRLLGLRRLLAEKKQTELLVSSISEGIFLLRGTQILYLNSVGEKILGPPPPAQGGQERTASSWVNRDLAELLEQNQSPGAFVGAKALLAEKGKSIPTEFTLSSEASKTYYLLRYFPISNEAIAQIETAYAEFAAFYNQEHWGADTLILAQDVTVLHESQDAKSYFIANLSHEVKTPVTSLTMATRLLKKSAHQIPNPVHQKLINTCVEDVDRLRSLIEDLLTISRFDTLTQKLDLKSINICKLLRQAIQFHQDQAFERGVEVKMVCPQCTYPMNVSIDIAKMSWAISNLISGAIQKCPRGGKTFFSVHKEGEIIEVKIRNNGIAGGGKHPAGVLENFGPEYHLSEVRGESRGTGIAIAKEIIASHGGRFSVRESSGGGAETIFTLPSLQEPFYPAFVSLSQHQYPNTKNERKENGKHSLGG